MATIKRFEDLHVWSRSRSLCCALYDISARGIFTRDYTLKDQTRRAAMSVPLNIAEGFARKSRREFQRSLFTAYGAIAEVQTCLYLALDQRYIDELAFDHLYKESEEISRMINGLITYLRS